MLNDIARLQDVIIYTSLFICKILILFTLLLVIYQKISIIEG
jgi:hypothetical protein